MLSIMIVDDMDIVRREMKRLSLWSNNEAYMIACEASNGYEALKMLENYPVDLIITDIRMPKINGIELLKKVIEEGLCTCVVLMSDHSDFNYARQGLVLGAFDYLVKPVKEEELRNVLERASNFLESRQNELQKLQQLELKLASKKEAYFPNAELNQVIEYLINKDDRYKEYAALVVEMTYNNIDNDSVMLEAVLNEALLTIANHIQNTNKWLNKFLSEDKLRRIDISKLGDSETVKAEFMWRIQSIMELQRKLLFGSSQDGLVNQVCACVLENIDGNVSLQTVSELIFMNKSYISEAFKQKTGMSFTEYMTIIKIERAKKLMTDERLKNYEVAQLLGFKDIEYFSKLFKKYTSLSPTEYRQSQIRN